MCTYVNSTLVTLISRIMVYVKWLYKCINWGEWLLRMYKGTRTDSGGLVYLVRERVTLRNGLCGVATELVSYMYCFLAVKSHLINYFLRCL